MKKLIALVLFSLSSPALAQTGAPIPGVRPSINAQTAPSPKAKEIQACLQKQLGTPGQGPTPSKEKIQAAFTACNVKMPPAGAVRGNGTAPMAPTAPPSNTH